MLARFDPGELVVKTRNVLSCGRPQAVEIEVVILVHDDVALSDHVSPRQLWMAIAQLW